MKFDEEYARRDLDLEEALRLLDYTAYFDLRQLPQPFDACGIASPLLDDGILARQDNGLYAVTSPGAVLLAKRLPDFPQLSRRALRIVQYRGSERLHMLRERTLEKGYAAGFEECMMYIGALLPEEQGIEGAFRRQRTAYPVQAVREIVLNALVHQDFSLSGTGPVVEIFEDRVEVTNPGTFLSDKRRILDSQPCCRNAKLASLMHRLGLCGQSGTGWLRAASACEAEHVPAPRIDLYEKHTRVTLYQKMPFGSMLPDDKLWACYLHACIRQIQGGQMTNASLRERFGLKGTASGCISRLIQDAVQKNCIRLLDADAAPRYRKYIPFGA